MTGMLKAMMPRALDRAITVFAWLWLPLHAGAGAGYAAGLDASGMVLLSGAAVASTVCLVTVYREHRVDARILAGLRVHQQHEAELALLAGTKMDSGMVKAAATPQRGQSPDRLRLVEGSS